VAIECYELSCKEIIEVHFLGQSLHAQVDRERVNATILTRLKRYENTLPTERKVSADCFDFIRSSVEHRAGEVVGKALQQEDLKLADNLAENQLSSSVVFAHCDTNKIRRLVSYDTVYLLEV
jgi:hypothetical protein